MTDYAAVLTREYPGREWSLNNNDYATPEWYDDVAKADQKDPRRRMAAGRLRRPVRRRRSRPAAHAYQAQTDGMYFHAIRHSEPLDDWEAGRRAIKVRVPLPTGASMNLTDPHTGPCGRSSRRSSPSSSPRRSSTLPCLHGAAIAAGAAALVPIKEYARSQLQS
jgi:hypothetical protein